MKKIIILLMLLLLSVTFASAETIKIGGEKVTYDQIMQGDSDFDGINDRTSYYLENILVFSAYDTNGDGKQDMWFTYVEGTYPETAMRDTTGDGRPENIITLDKEGEIITEKERGKNQWIYIVIGVIVICGLAYFFLKEKKKKVRRNKSEGEKQKKEGRRTNKLKNKAKKYAQTSKKKRNKYIQK